MQIRRRWRLSHSRQRYAPLCLHPFPRRFPKSQLQHRRGRERYREDENKTNGREDSEAAETRGEGLTYANVHYAIYSSRPRASSWLVMSLLVVAARSVVPSSPDTSGGKVPRVCVCAFDSLCRAALPHITHKHTNKRTHKQAHTHILLRTHIPIIPSSHSLETASVRLSRYGIWYSRLHGACFSHLLMRLVPSVRYGGMHQSRQLSNSYPNISETFFIVLLPFSPLRFSTTICTIA
ncbi:hypothetical protein F5B22DRAFT_493600 [Xylaria bambusicola]|uniref:uncharacterized protein n=1 Tax=Xylaria bambusicola TaxID=326684 RepID=UPI002008207E|nr:uncharacterized protein F5B22DRAFT_493600 [Xylaria bambusicola]KAI0505823.1 hypothetical protein F5B22DRAFT_493600 [Xylaria bambusicola]